MEKKYKVIKEFYRPYTGNKADKGEKFYSNTTVYIKYLLEEGFIEKINEDTKEKPKFKLGDYVVLDHSDFNISYHTISEISHEEGIYTYDGGFESKYFRKPTQEELDLYFKQDITKIDKRKGLDDLVHRTTEGEYPTAVTFANKN